MANLLTINQSINGRYLESRAEAIVMPGQVLRRTATDRVIPHNESLKSAQVLIAQENQYTGAGIDAAYAIGDVVNMRLCLPGDRALCWLDTGQTASIGSYLASAGNGNLRELLAGAPDDAIVGCALEAVDATAGAKRILVEVM